MSTQEGVEVVLQLADTQIIRSQKKIDEKASTGVDEQQLAEYVRESRGARCESLDWSLL